MMPSFVALVFFVVVLPAARGRGAASNGYKTATNGRGFRSGACAVAKRWANYTAWCGANWRKRCSFCIFVQYKSVARFELQQSWKKSARARAFWRDEVDIGRGGVRSRARNKQ